MTCAMAPIGVRPLLSGDLRFFFDLLVNLFSPLPYAIARYRSAQQRARIADLAHEVDLVVCDFLTPSVNVPYKLSTRAVLFQHNVESIIWERHATVPQNSVRRLYMRQQWRKMQRFESRMCRQFEHVVAVSNDDARVIDAALAFARGETIGDHVQGSPGLM